MKSQVIQFQCQACQALLTVPAHLAGVTGPCPKCGQTITSPAAPAPVAAVPAIPTAPLPASPPAAAPQTAPPAPAAAWPGAQVPAAAQAPAFPAAPGAPLPSAPAAGAVLPPRRDAPAPPPSLLAGFHSPAPHQPPAEAVAPASGPSLPSSAPKLPVLEDPRPSQAAAPSASASGSLLTSLLNAPETASAAGSRAASPPPAQEPPSPAPAITNAPRETGRKPLPPFPDKPRRSSNWARLGIAAVLLLGGAALLAYAARAPLLDLYYRHVAPLMQPAEPPPVAVAEPPLSPTPAEETPAPLPAPSAPEAGTEKPAGINPPLPGQLAAEDPPPPVAAAKSDDPVLPAIPSVPAGPDAGEIPMEIKRAAPALPGEVAAVPAPPPPVTPDALMEVPAGQTTQPAAPSSTPALAISDEAKPAADALMAFLAADTLEGKRQFILGAGDPQIDALVERYYGQADAVPIPVTSIGLIRHDPNPEVGGGMQSVFMVASPDWTYPIPVMVQETKSGYKLDWIAFIEFKDNWLFKFVQGFRENPGRFHVSIKRGHYFERDVPDLEEKDCFIIQPPQEDFEVSVFVPKNTPLAEKLRRDLSWSTQYAYVLAEIQWRDDGAHQWIELTAVPQLNWYITTETPGAGAAVESGGGKESK